MRNVVSDVKLGNGLRVFENRARRRVFGPKRDKVGCYYPTRELRVLIGRVADTVQPRGRSVQEGDEKMKRLSQPPPPPFRIHMLIAHDKIFIVSNYCVSSEL
jgi:hypothetical protein